jgi:hypothetical protein
MTAMYKITDYATISSSMKYTLPDTVLQIIKQLGVELGVSTNPLPPPADTANNYSSDDRNRRANVKRGRLGNNHSDGGWEKQVPFKTTDIAKKEGIDKLFTEIKGGLNKLSIKNYDTIETSVFEYIENTFAHPDCDDDFTIQKIASLIFEVACINKTHSELYAKLYRNLVDVHPELKSPIAQFKTTYLTSFDNIVYVDPDKDYNKYCEITKENDKRKSISVFLVNLMNHKLMTEDDIIEILTTIKDKVVLATDIEGQMHYVEELIEILNVYIKAAFGYLREHADWKAIGTHIYQYSAYKAKDHPGLSSRIIFKYMDMKDIMTKCIA